MQKSPSGSIFTRRNQREVRIESSLNTLLIRLIIDLAAVALVVAVLCRHYFHYF